MLTRFATAAGLLALTSGLALAQAPATPTAVADKDAKEFKIALVAKTSLAQAITAAEGKGDEKGGRAIDADFEKGDGKNPAHYAIKVVYPSGKLVEYGINADTAEVYKTENQPIERYFTRLKPADFQNAKVSLKDAIGLAEQKVPGSKAYEAEVEREGKAVEYEIKVALPEREQEIKVHADGTVKND